MDIYKTSSRSWMKTLFVSCDMLLRRHRIPWIVEENEKIAVGHFLSFIQPKSSHDRLESHFQFAQTNCWKDFTKFMRYNGKISEPFQIFDNGPRHWKAKPSRGNRREILDGASSKWKSTSVTGSRSDGKGRGHAVNKRGILLYFPFHSCTATREKHLIKNYPKESHEEKSNMFDYLKLSKLRDAPLRVSRRQKGRKVLIQGLRDSN